MTDAIDMRDTVAPKSSQLNADDLIAGPLTVRITEVKRGSTAEQPIAIGYDGDGGKPYFPCKSMRRVMITAWGVDAAGYVGRSMTLYRDDKVLWGGMAVGGIRISHMTHIDGPQTMVLTESKSSRKPFRVLPLELPKEDRAPLMAQSLVERIDATESTATLDALLADETVAKQRAWLGKNRPELATDVEAAVMGARARVVVVQ